MNTRLHSSSRRACLLAAAAIVLVGASMVPPAFAQSRSGFEYNGIVHVSWWFNEYNNFDQPTGAATDS
ncbi:MAG TPA: hypothetical protein VJ302_17285, partial [Blastocatellia bacterium]|nr:hypothetical protein [Blastocatellia bacterium]